MDKLLLKHCVAAAEIEKLAKNISRFHQQTDVIFSKRLKDIKDLFNDLKRQENFLQSHLLCHGLIANAIKISNEFFSQNEPLFTRRLQGGYMRDCHGDLHTRNIFLLPEPQPFDCIEFNDDFRRIDVLDEIAFLCMDLGALAERIWHTCSWNIIIFCFQPCKQRKKCFCLSIIRLTVQTFAPK